MNEAQDKTWETKAGVRFDPDMIRRSAKPTIPKLRKCVMTALLLGVLTCILQTRRDIKFRHNCCWRVPCPGASSPPPHRTFQCNRFSYHPIAITSVLPLWQLRLRWLQGLPLVLLCGPRPFRVRHPHRPAVREVLRAGGHSEASQQAISRASFPTEEIAS